MNAKKKAPQKGAPLNKHLTYTFRFYYLNLLATASQLTTFQKAPI